MEPRVFQEIFNEFLSPALRKAYLPILYIRGSPFSLMDLNNNF